MMSPGGKNILLGQRSLKRKRAVNESPEDGEVEGDLEAADRLVLLRVGFFSDEHSCHSCKRHFLSDNELQYHYLREHGGRAVSRPLAVPVRARPAKRIKKSSTSNSPTEDSVWIFSRSFSMLFLFLRMSNHSLMADEVATFVSSMDAMPLFIVDLISRHFFHVELSLSHSLAPCFISHWWKATQV